MIGQPGPHRRPGLLEVGLLLLVQIPAFLNRLGHIVHLLAADEPGDRSGDGGIAEDVANRQAGDAAVFLRRWAVEGAVPFEQGVAGEGFYAEDADIVFLDGLEDAVGGQDLVLAVYGVTTTSITFG